jgi:outer membrane protein TolC
MRDETSLLVVSQYLAALRSGEQLKAAQSRVELAQALFDQAAQLEENGIGTNLDTVRAQVELQNEKQLLLVVQTDRAKALFGLAQLLDLPPQRQIELTDQALFSATPQFTADASVAAALANRPELKSLDTQVASAHHDLRAALEERLPSLSIDGNWAYQGESLESAIPTYVVGATVSIPLWIGGRIRAEQAKASVEVHRLENQRRGERDAIADEVQSAQVDLDSARSQVEVARSGLALAQKALDQSRERFASGIANNIEVVTAQDSLARASDNLIDALYRYNLAHAQLAHATGQMEAMYER